MSAKPHRPRQLPLDLGHGTGHSRDELVVSAANAEAAALIDRWPDWPALVVVLAGPPRRRASRFPANRGGDGMARARPGSRVGEGGGRP